MSDPSSPDAERLPVVTATPRQIAEPARSSNMPEPTDVWFRKVWSERDYLWAFRRLVDWWQYLALAAGFVAALAYMWIMLSAP